MIKYISLNIGVELFCFCIAAGFLYREKNRGWRSMLFFMLITCITEISGRAMYINNYDNNWLYNIYLIAEVGFNLFMYDYLVSKYKSSKKPVLFACLVLGLSYTYEIIVDGIKSENTITITLMSVLFTGYSLYYYYLLIKNEDYLILIKYPPFWWVAGNLLFYYGSMASATYFLFFTKHNTLFTNRNNVYLFLDIILYCFWSYSFICRYYQRKLTP